MPQLVHENQHAQHHDDRADRQEHAASSASRRASASAESTVASDAAGTGCQRSSTRAITSAMRPNVILPSRKRATATSFAALNAAGAVPPVTPAARPSAYARNRSGFSDSNVSAPATIGS